MLISPQPTFISLTSSLVLWQMCRTLEWLSGVGESRHACKHFYFRRQTDNIWFHCSTLCFPPAAQPAAFPAMSGAPLKISKVLRLHKGLRILLSLNCDWRRKKVGGEEWSNDFADRPICLDSSMIASWFSMARKCEELGLQRDVCPHQH